MDAIALAVSAAVPGVYTGGLNVLGFNTVKAVDEVVAGSMSEKRVGFVWINGEMEDPVFQFWRLRDVQVLEDDCHVVFTHVKDSPSWADLERVYGGIRFGTLFLLVFRKTRNPGILPSQRGMYA